MYEIVVGKQGEKGVSSSVKKRQNRGEDPQGEKNEQMKSLLKEAVREELERFFEQVTELTEWELGKLEATVVKTNQELGRILLEGMRNSRAQEQRPASQA